MAAPNFHVINANNYYVVGDYTLYEDEDGNTKKVQKDEADYFFDIENLKDIGISKGFRKDSDNYNPTFEASSILYKSDYHQYGKDDYLNAFRVEANIYAIGGRYGGMVYDWDVSFLWNSGSGDCKLSEFEDTDGMLDYIMDDWQDTAESYSDWNTGLIKCHKDKIRAYVEKIIKQYADEADGVCDKACEQPMGISARFSNGETWYAPVGKVREGWKEVCAA